MKFWNSKLAWLMLAAALAVLMLQASGLDAGSPSAARQPNPAAADLPGFTAMAPIDAHAHVYADDPSFAAMLKRLNLRILDICVIDDRDAFS